jgi:putative transposase
MTVGHGPVMRRATTPVDSAHPNLRLSTSLGAAEWPKEFYHIYSDPVSKVAILERFNRTYRTEVVSTWLFELLAQMIEISNEWLQSYNEKRSHDV